MSNTLIKIGRFLTQFNVSTVADEHCLRIAGSRMVFFDTEHCVLFFAQVDAMIPLDRVMNCLDVINEFNRDFFSYIKIIFNIMPSSKEDGYLTCSYVYEIPYDTKHVGESAYMAIKEAMEYNEIFELELQAAIDGE